MSAPSGRDDDDRTAASAAAGLRRVPWLLAAICLVTVVARIALSGTGVTWGGALGLAAGTVVFIAALWLWALRLDRRAQAATAGETGVLFSCSNTINRAALAEVPQFSETMRRVRFAFVVGGWLMGRLDAGTDGLRWMPNPWTRRLLRAGPLWLPWGEVEEVEVLGQPGPREAGVLGLRLDNGATCAFMITRRHSLERVLEAHRLPAGAVPFLPAEPARR